ncbi:hypothetical protein AKJ64_00335 [candidate division MSBL1 archaeon SCGC-AAA259E17]|uniref:Uncharacterized protein n=1 Tax=candidate division MSBL1 archaeon SCGC-AAA259E17 TaxID=1698263 RepID=A0A133UH95_9EURY|nr:hypothetical protein AKJ64_00335 [candidate division MSBL1 archaeon SCGC-AAA259E17]
MMVIFGSRALLGVGGGEAVRRLHIVVWRRPTTGLDRKNQHTIKYNYGCRDFILKEFCDRENCQIVGKTIPIKN